MARVVVAAGEGARTPVGTLGAVYLLDYCRTCRCCLGGHTNMCEEFRAAYRLQ